MEQHGQFPVPDVHTYFIHIYLWGRYSRESANWSRAESLPAVNTTLGELQEVHKFHTRGTLFMFTILLLGVKQGSQWG